MKLILWKKKINSKFLTFLKNLKKNSNKSFQIKKFNGFENFKNSILTVKNHDCPSRSPERFSLLTFLHFFFKFSNNTLQERSRRKISIWKLYFLRVHFANPKRTFVIWVREREKYSKYEVCIHKTFIALSLLNYGLHMKSKKIVLHFTLTWILFLTERRFIKRDWWNVRLGSSHVSAIKSCYGNFKFFMVIIAKLTYTFYLSE